MLPEKLWEAVGERTQLKLIVVRASQAPASNMRPIKANQTRVAKLRRPSLSAQQCLYFLPLPHAQGSFRPGRLLTHPPLLWPQAN
jgi:hypothetical protein